MRSTTTMDVAELTESSLLFADIAKMALKEIISMEKLSGEISCRVSILWMLNRRMANHAVDV